MQQVDFPCGGVPRITAHRPHGQRWWTSHSVNRLTQAQETGTGSWTQNYVYDAYGNLAVTANTSLPMLTNETPTLLTQYNSRNQIGGWTYDASGNIQQVGTMARLFTYDAENRQLTANVAGIAASNYVYDAAGRRVQKTTAWGSTTYVYDAFGQLAAEYGTADDAGTKYLTADALGSTRMVTAVGTSGPVVAQNCDYLPFGGEFGATTANRDSTFCPGTYPSAATDPSVKFTLKYRDPHGLTYRVCDADGKNCGYLSDADFEAEQKADRSNGAYFSSGSIYHYDSNGNRVNDGAYVQTDVDIDSPAFGAVQSGALAAKTSVDVLGYTTLGMLTGGFGIEAAGLAEGATLIPGLAPTGEYTSAIRALDALGGANPGATLSPAQARALAQNVADVLRVTAVAAATKGGPYIESLRRQLANPRFAFLDQVPGPLKEAIVNAAAKVGINVR